MSLIERARAVFKEGEVYQQQGLFEQAKKKYLQILETAKKDEQLVGDEAFIATVQEKLSMVENTLNSIDEENEMPKLSEDVQDLITDLFASSKNKDIAAIDGAVALVNNQRVDETPLDEHDAIDLGGYRLRRFPYGCHKE